MFEQITVLVTDHAPEARKPGRHFETLHIDWNRLSMGDRMKKWGAFGALWGGLWGALLGAVIFSLPDTGLASIAGPLVGWICGTLLSAAVVGGLAALGMGIYIDLLEDQAPQAGSGAAPDRKKALVLPVG